MKNNKGAFDKNGVWWTEQDILAFTAGTISQFFGKKKEDIKIEDKK